MRLRPHQPTGRIAISLVESACRWRISEIEKEVIDYANEVLKTRELSPKTEFHGNYIYSGKGPFKGVPAEKRIEIILKLTDIIGMAPVKRVFAEIISNRLKYIGAAEPAFMFFCERVQLLMFELKSHTILIGDQDDNQMKEMISRFLTYRLTGTYWAYGIKIESFVDSITLLGLTILG